MGCERSVLIGLTGINFPAYAFENQAETEGFAKMGVPQGAIVPLGIVELLCLALFLIPRTAVLGTLLLTGYLGGATLANIVGRTDFIHALVIGLFVWAVAWLRVAELQRLIPLRKPWVTSDGQRPGACCASKAAEDLLNA